MGKRMNISKSVDRKEILLFLGFYVASTFIYYTATWITWGGLESGNPPYFDLEEFFAAAGTDFIISFLVTVPIWYMITVVLQKNSYPFKLAAHIIFLPLYLFVCYYAQYAVKDFFGWAMFWGGKKAIWTYYHLMLFYLAQFALIHAYTYFKRFKKEETEKFELREIALNSEMTALKAQLNPHFLHNLFNAINASIPPENERTRELIIQLSDLFRYQNYASQQEFVTIKEEMDFVENYLQLMKVRLKERLNYHFEVPAQLYGFKIAPMLLHPLVENAVTHGIAPKIEPSCLVLKITKNKDKVVFLIEDTGVGISDKNAALSKGIGLANTKKRLAKIYGSELKMEDNFPTGTKISFAI
jgi:two-component system LytT family sensor kinase